MNEIDIKTIIYIMMVWSAMNIILPLFVNSIGRLYEKQIDSLVKSLVSLGKGWLFFFVKILITIVLTALQILLVVIMLPTMLWVPFAERFLPTLFTFEIFNTKPFEDQRYIAKLAIKRNFWEIVINEIRKND